MERGGQCGRWAVSWKQAEVGAGLQAGFRGECVGREEGSRCRTRGSGVRQGQRRQGCPVLRGRWAARAWEAEEQGGR